MIVFTIGVRVCLYSSIDSLSLDIRITQQSLAGIYEFNAQKKNETKFSNSLNGWQKKFESAMD
jgi:hypothetical protein